MFGNISVGPAKGGVTYMGSVYVSGCALVIVVVLVNPVSEPVTISAPNSIVFVTPPPVRVSVMPE